MPRAAKKRRREEDSEEDEEEDSEETLECWVASYAPPAKCSEKRAARWRSHASADARARIDRALSQRMYLLEEQPQGRESRVFKVLGSTGNVYDVTIGRSPSCTCPDALKGRLCKHVFFAMVRVLRCDRDAPIVHQAALLGAELRALFSRADARRWRPPEANDATKRAYLAATGRASGVATAAAPEQNDDDDDCAICFEALRGARVVRCEMQCKKALHEDCFRRWATAAADRLTCPSCRAPWPQQESRRATTGAATAAVVNEGYLNFAATQGQRTVRDTSTYASPPAWRFSSSSSRGRRRARRRRW